MKTPIARRTRYRLWTTKWLWIPVLVMVIVLLGCTISRSPVTGERAYYGYTWQEEKDLGAQADKQIQARYGIYQEGDITKYVQGVAQKVLEHSHLRGEGVAEQYRETEFTFRVLDSPVINAFALPGGYVYVTRGLLAYLQNEAQLAVVLGHEIGHVAERHASRQAFQQTLGQIGLLGGAILGQEVFNVPAQQILDVGGTAVQLLHLRYSREHERESDHLGVEYAAKAGYKASEGSSFFWVLEQMGERDGQTLPTFLSTHPDPGNREEMITELAAKWSDSTETTIVNQEQYMNQLRDLVFSENPRQGFVRDGMFYHPDMQFQFSIPSGWKVQNTASQVVILEPEQQAALIFSTDPEAKSVKEAAERFAGQQGVQVERVSETSVHDMPAYRVIATAQSQQNNQRIRLLSVFIRKSDTIYQFMAFSNDALFSTYASIFQKTIRSFDDLQDRKILQIQPWRLTLITTDHQGSLEEFVPAETSEEFGLSMLGILNQLQPNTVLRENHTIKIPRR